MRSSSPVTSTKISPESQSSNSSKSLTNVRIYYAVPVGEFRWKVTFMALGLTSADNLDTDVHIAANATDWISNVSTLLDGENCFLNLDS